MTVPIRSRLLAGAAAASLGAALLPGAARAQAFDGTPFTVFGSITRTTAAGKETITVDTPSAVVNWIPNSNAQLTPFDFLPAGNVATFQNGASNENFMILNRILPDNGRPMAFNGSVVSLLKTAAGDVPGGTVVFYTPGGILIGAKAVFNVGNLLLTTIDPVVDQNGNFFVGNGYSLSGPVNSKSFVRIDPGAQVNALQAGSYVALASPVVQQFGDVRVNGSVAYVAAESVRLTIDSGLFDIQVKLGSSSAAATVDHRGSTGGPASDGPGDNQAIYMVAVPKNTAISLLLRGNAGYDVAAGATQENGAIILSAGYNVNLIPTQATPASGVAAAIDIRQANISSDLTGLATTSAAGTAFGGESLRFAGDLTLVAPDVALGSEGGLVMVGGDAILTTGRRDDFNFTDAAGGKARLFARGGGSVAIAGSARVIASARSPAGQSATGGDATVAADNGGISIGGDLLVDAEAEAGSDSLSDPGGATGGTARLALLNGGAVGVAGSADVTASAAGGRGFGIGDGTPGVAQGGNAGVAAASGGQANFGALTVRSSAEGGSVIAGTPSAGLGGQAELLAAPGGAIAVAGATRIEADGLGGTGVSETPVLPDISGAGGSGGIARILVDGGSVQLDSLRATALGTGGAATGTGTNGGSGVGGQIELDVNGALAARDSLLQAFGTAGAGPNGTADGGNILAAGADAGISGERLTAQAGLDASLSGVRMTDLLDVTAQGRIAVAGTVSGRTISLASGDIAIPAAGALGAADTQQITFRVLPSGKQTVIGGTAAAPGYTLDRNELGRVRGGRLTILVPPTGVSPPPGADVLVDSLTLAADLQPDPFTFEILTAGTIRVAGDVLMTGADAADRMNFFAGGRFEVITPAGSLRLLDGAGNPAGLLGIGSANIVVADAALAAQLAANPDFPGRNTALLSNPAPANQRGYVEAGGVAFTPTQSVGAPSATLFVQNTGASFATLAGVTVGSGGLTIAPSGQATVVGFGRQRNADGSFTQGEAFFRLATFDRAKGGFTDDSELNRCNINSGLCPADPQPPKGPQLVPPGARPALSRVALGPPLPPESESRDDVINEAGLGAIPLIDEPVTSGGDSGLWGDDDPKDDE